MLDGLASRRDLATARARPPPRTGHSPRWPASAILIDQVQYLQRVALVLHVGEGAVPQALRHKQRTGHSGRELDSRRKDTGASPPERDEETIDNEYVLALPVRLCELDPHAALGELDFEVDESRILLRAVQAVRPITPNCSRASNASNDSERPSILSSAT